MAELLPDGVEDFKELYEAKGVPNGVRTFQGPWPRDVVELLLARALTHGSEVGIEYGEVVVRYAADATSTLTPAETPFVRPYAEPSGCRHCGLTRPHPTVSVLGGPTHAYTPPTDAQRLARMWDRRKRRAEQ
ncbi:hypothetical protein ABZT26_36050 [Streptomyces sp. NPDC005395]|uniref:hypothetical protein n=1 Tax=Streptomyces sp. NPDC005395 TaxID=3157042 RepID=UPI0033A7D444